MENKLNSRRRIDFICVVFYINLRAVILKFKNLLLQVEVFQYRNDESRFHIYCCNSEKKVRSRRETFVAAVNVPFML